MCFQFVLKNVSPMNYCLLHRVVIIRRLIITIILLLYLFYTGHPESKRFQGHIGLMSRQEQGFVSCFAIYPPTPHTGRDPICVV